MLAKTALYRHWDKDGNLLYVGISMRPFERLASHVYGSHWADTIERVTMEYFDTRAENAVGLPRPAWVEGLPAVSRAKKKPRRSGGCFVCAGWFPLMDSNHDSRRQRPMSYR